MNITKSIFFILYKYLLSKSSQMTDRKRIFIKILNFYNPKYKQTKITI